MDLVEAASGLADEGVRHPWETARLAVVKRLVAGHVELAPGSVVLDIGCGDGFVAGALAAMFPASTFYGIDSGLTPAAIAAAARRLPHPNLHLFRSLDDITDRPARPAALVLLMDVIEHIEDDAAFLRGLAAHPLVDRNTLVLVTVPAYQWLFSAHDVFLKHYRRYSNAILRRRLEESGWRVLDIGYFFASLVPLRLLQVIKERILGRREPGASDLMTSHGAASASLMSRVLVADATLGLGLGRAGITLPGLSNYALCRTSA